MAMAGIRPIWTGFSMRTIIQVGTTMDRLVKSKRMNKQKLEDPLEGGLENQAVYFIWCGDH